MATLTFPSTYDPATVTWQLRAPTQTHESPLDGTTQTLRLPAERWVATLS